MAHQVILETERLVLREMTMDDEGDLSLILSDAETMRYYPQPLDPQGLVEWIERNLDRYRQYGHGLWAVILKSEQKLVGSCGLAIMEIDGVQELEVGYQFNRNYWGRGLATEAARACMEYARNQLGRHRIISMIRPENVPSCRVAERNGLKIEKQMEWKGYLHYVYSIEME
jgi:RimJ/RimL family protein N-acetyltransferase